MYLPEFLNLGAGFSKYFRALPALDEDLRRAVFTIRHAVYCDELGYEAARADRLESDDFDARSVHCLLQERAQRRLRRLRAPGPRGCKRPASRIAVRATVCGASLDRNVVDPARLDRTKDRRGVAARRRQPISSTQGRADGGAWHRRKRFRDARPTAFPLHRRRSVPRHDRAGPPPRHRHAVHADGAPACEAAVATRRRTCARSVRRSSIVAFAIRR